MTSMTFDLIYLCCLAVPCLAFIFPMLKSLNCIVKNVFKQFWGVRLRWPKLWPFISDNLGRAVLSFYFSCVQKLKLYCQKCFQAILWGPPVMTYDLWPHISLLYGGAVLSFYFFRLQKLKLYCQKCFQAILRGPQNIFLNMNLNMNIELRPCFISTTGLPIVEISSTHSARLLPCFIPTTGRITTYDYRKFRQQCRSCDNSKMGSAVKSYSDGEFVSKIPFKHHFYSNAVDFPTVIYIIHPISSITTRSLGAAILNFQGRLSNYQNVLVDR